MSNEKKVLMKIEHLTKEFEIKSKKLGGKPQILHALNDVSVDIYEGETLGVIGESGCGKSTFGRTLIQLHKATAGSVTFDGKDLFSLKGAELKKAKKDVQMVFQDPYSSLDPRKTAGKLIEEPLIVHKLISDKNEREKRVLELMREVGLDIQHVHRFPHEFSGGQRQRINVARALAMNPKVIVCDEPVSALDVSIQAQILKLMNELKKEKGTSILFITHDLGVINQMADEVAVMYCGQVVEMCKARTIFAKETTCSQPYTEGLMTSIPRLDTPVGARLEAIPGAVPHPLNLPKGCKFAPRCKYATEKCMNEEPKLELAEDNHLIRCFYPDKEARHAK